MLVVYCIFVINQYRYNTFNDAIHNDSNTAIGSAIHNNKNTAIGSDVTSDTYTVLGGFLYYRGLTGFEVSTELFFA